MDDGDLALELVDGLGNVDGSSRRRRRDHVERSSRVTIFSRPGCHLCDEMKGVVDRVCHRLGLQVNQVDISTDRTLEQRYGRDIPVLAIDGRVVARHRIGEVELMEGLKRGGVAG